MTTVDVPIKIQWGMENRLRSSEPAVDGGLGCIMALAGPGMRLSCELGGGFK